MTKKTDVLEQFTSTCGKCRESMYDGFDPRVRRYVIPERIVWRTQGEENPVENAEKLLVKSSGQITFLSDNPCVLQNRGGRAGLLLDFGVELHGSIRIFIWKCGSKKDIEQRNMTRIRIRFGESAMEAMSELCGNNDHAIRDQVLEVSFLSAPEIGPSGFRFVRIDLIDEDSFIEIKSVQGVFIYRDIEYKGSFCCNDEQLNDIWLTGAYTVHLNMQEYLWDGIKRDRLVWIGDMHPEVSTIQAVFGYNEVVPKSLDLIKEVTPLPGWMNTISSYSLWWVLIHYGWYMQNGKLEYLREQQDYIIGLLEMLLECIGIDNRECLPDVRFIDWPSYENKQAVHAGLHSLLVMTLNAGAVICRLLGETEHCKKYLKSVERLQSYKPDSGDSKQAAALMALAGLADPLDINKNVLAKGGANGMSTYIGYYILQARAMAGDIKGCLECIREYWGGMIKLGATTFWEDFDINWTVNAAGIDDLVPKGKKDIHGDYGAHCYKGFRHSLCHGWASGPTAWLSEHVLGVKILEPGCRIIRIKPELGDLEWVEGTYPTPEGIIQIRHFRDSTGNIKSLINAPHGIQVIK